MNKIFQLNRRCYELISGADKEFMEIYGEELTPEFLLYYMMADEDTLLSKYIRENALASSYIEEIYIQKLDDEGLYDLFIIIIQEIIEEIEKKTCPRYLTINDVLERANVIAQYLLKDKIDEICLTIAIVQLPNELWEWLDIMDQEDSESKIIYHFSLENVNYDGNEFLEDPKSPHGYN